MRVVHIYVVQITTPTWTPTIQGGKENQGMRSVSGCPLSLDDTHSGKRSNNEKATDKERGGRKQMGRQEIGEAASPP